jgi:hypothetical protein
MGANAAVLFHFMLMVKTQPFVAQVEPAIFLETFLT